MKSRLLASCLLAAASFSITSCKAPNSRSSEVMGVVPREDNMITDWVFFYGPRSVVKDITASGIQEQWKALTTSEALPMYQGLYVYQHPAYGEKAVLPNIYKPLAESPWLAGIKIKSSCRTEAVVVKEFPADITKNAMFREWIKTNESTTTYGETEFLEKCTKADVFTGTNNKCTATVDQFYKTPSASSSEGGGGAIQIVKDPANPKAGAWYLRSPSCIEQVRAGASDMLAMAADIPDFWAAAPYTDDTYREMTVGDLGFSGGDAQIYIFMRAIADLSSLDQATMMKIRQSAAKSDIQGLDNVVTKISEKALNCGLEAFKEELKEYLVFAEKSSTLTPAQGGMTFHNFKVAVEKQMKAPCGAPNQLDVVRQEERQRLEREAQAKVEAERQRQAQLVESERRRRLQAERDAFKCNANQIGPYSSNSTPTSSDCYGSTGTTHRISDGTYMYCCDKRGSTATTTNSGYNNRRGSCSGYQGRGYGASDCHSRYPGCFSPCTMYWEGTSRGGSCTCGN